MVYFTMREAKARGADCEEGFEEEEEEGEARVRGMPREIASRAAREKLSIEVMEMMVLEMHNRRDLRRVERGDRVVWSGGVYNRAARGKVPVSRIRGSVATWEGVMDGKLFILWISMGERLTF